MTTAVRKFSIQGIEPVVDELTHLLGAFKDKFMDVNKDEIQVIFSEADTSKFPAKIKLVSGYTQALTPKALALIVHRDSWEVADEYKRDMMLYEQLLYIEWDAEKCVYKLRRPDIQKMSEFITDFGLHGEKVRDVFDKAFNK